MHCHVVKTLWYCAIPAMQTAKAHTTGRLLEEERIQYNTTDEQARPHNSATTSLDRINNNSGTHKNRTNTLHYSRLSAFFLSFFFLSVVVASPESPFSTVLFLLSPETLLSLPVAVLDGFAWISVIIRACLKYSSYCSSSSRPASSLRADSGFG